uniref:glutathione transferase n=1 Tax=Kalanchoe fedtschenkoi TaxID=63787 RepID=A0A7N0UI13_KALFE
MAGGVRKVYGSLECPNTLKVLACIFEHSLDFQFIPINLKEGEHKREPFLSLNPFGVVPVLEHDGYKQFECRAIIRAMAHEFSSSLQDNDLIYWDERKQAIVSNWVDVEDHKFEPPALELINELAIKPENGLEPDETVVAKAEAKLGAVLDVYEARLGKFKYLAADKFTIADLLHLPNLQSLLGTARGKKLIESRPKVSLWCSQILARPAWSSVLQMKNKPPQSTHL